MNTTTTAASTHPSMSTKFIEIHGVEQTFKTRKGLFPALKDINPENDPDLESYPVIDDLPNLQTMYVYSGVKEVPPVLVPDPMGGEVDVGVDPAERGATVEAEPGIDADLDAVARAFLSAAVTSFLERRSVADVRAEVLAAADNVDPDTDYMFMRP